MRHRWVTKRVRMARFVYFNARNLRRFKRVIRFILRQPVITIPEIYTKFKLKLQNSFNFISLRGRIQVRSIYQLTLIKPPVAEFFQLNLFWQTFILLKKITPPHPILLSGVISCRFKRDAAILPNINALESRLNWAVDFTWRRYLMLMSDSSIGKPKFKFITTTTSQSNPEAYLNSILLPTYQRILSSPVSVQANLIPTRSLTWFENSYLALSIISLRRTTRQFTILFVAQEYIELLYLTVKLRDLDLVVYYMQRLISKLIIWDHKKLFTFFFSMYKEHIYPAFKVMGVMGLKIQLSGKIGVGGNSRKRRLRMNLGKVTTSSFNQNANFINKIWRTKTGVLGLQMVLIY